MIEQAMIFALGFLVAALLALLFLPAVQRRAARLASRRLEMLLPLSMEEVIAERDQLRAEFAVERRRIEQRLEAAGDAQAQHMGELGRQAGIIDSLTAQLAQTREELLALGEANDALQREMAEAEAVRGAAQKALDDESNAHAATRESLEALRAEHDALDQRANEQRAALAGVETRAAALDLRIVALNHQKAELEKNLQGKTSEAEVLLAERDLARTERDRLETVRATLQRRLDEEALRAADLRDQIEALRRRVEEADRARVAREQARDVAEQHRDAAMRKVEEDENRSRTLQSVAAERHASQVAEIATLTGALQSARSEINRLQQERRARENETASKLDTEIGKARAAEAEWQARHRKQAAEIAVLTAALEEARQQLATAQQASRNRETELQSNLQIESQKARAAEAEWQPSHASQQSEVAGPVAFLEEGDKQATPGAMPVTAEALIVPDLSISQREETALLRQAIADLGSEVVRIAASLRESPSAEDDAPIRPDVMEMRQRRARAQPRT